MKKSYDLAVIGAGVFGAWTAHYLHRSGATVALIDSYGVGNNRSSSGGETRVMRMGYGPDELYTRWAKRSLILWREFFDRIGRSFFHRTGVLWLSDGSDSYVDHLAAVLRKNDVPVESFPAGEIAGRYPQFRFPEVTGGVLEPESGVLMARQSVQAVVEDAVNAGCELFLDAALPPHGKGRLAQLKLASGATITADTFVFACGAWLPKVFPDPLANRIFPTRQEVFFVGTPAGSDDFRADKMPVWLHHTHPNIPYALPDIENRGFKIAFDRHGLEFDPDSDSRIVGEESVKLLRRFLQEHVPALGGAPILETRVCQYENTSSGDFLIDRHPELENVWIVGGGSGHGFKHGPAVGEYVSGRILRDTPAEPRFAMETKKTSKLRAVY
jgi:glycine/D-amino acid oxidase-like deaminating enzyme